MAYRFLEWLSCCECGQTFAWNTEACAALNCHLRFEHGYSREDAYAAVGEAIDHASAPEES